MIINKDEFYTVLAEKHQDSKNIIKQICIEIGFVLKFQKYILM